MKHLKRFNLITESNTNKECVDLIIDAMRDFLDDDRKILFKSPIDDMRYQDQEISEEDDEVIKK